MRIVAGEFRSRVLTPLKGDQTRPTADKIKEAVFSSIGPYFSKSSIIFCVITSLPPTGQ